MGRSFLLRPGIICDGIRLSGALSMKNIYYLADPILCKKGADIPLLSLFSSQSVDKNDILWKFDLRIVERCLVFSTALC